MTEKNEVNEGDNAGVSPNSTLMDMINNSLQSSLRHKPLPPSAETRKCNNCGAARPTGTDLDICDFCKTPFN